MLLRGSQGPNWERKQRQEMLSPVDSSLGKDYKVTKRQNPRGKGSWGCRGVLTRAPGNRPEVRIEWNLL